MKNINKLVLLAGIAVPVFSSAQIVVSSPETATTPSLANSTFHNFVIAMTNNHADLYTPEGLSLSISSPIYFNYTPSTPGFSGGWSSTPGGGPLSTLEFVKVPNFSTFYLNAGGSMEVGFIGEESTHNNELGFHEGGIYTKLFDYNAGGDKAPMSYSLSSATATSLMFQHRNLTYFTGTGFQANPERFRIYQVLDNGKLTNEYLFAVADRDATKDGDYDDGFFYMVGDVTPVPEPAHIASLAVAFLFAGLFLRSRIKRRK